MIARPGRRRSRGFVPSRHTALISLPPLFRHGHVSPTTAIARWRWKSSPAHCDGSGASTISSSISRPSCCRARHRRPADRLPQPLSTASSRPRARVGRRGRCGRSSHAVPENRARPGSSTPCCARHCATAIGFRCRQPDAAGDSGAAAAYLGITHSHSDWLVQRWLRRYGFTMPSDGSASTTIRRRSRSARTRCA